MFVLVKDNLAPGSDKELDKLVFRKSPVERNSYRVR